MKNGQKGQALKIRIAYQPEEEQKAQAVAAMARHLLGDVRIHGADKHEPFRHLYITTKRPATGKASQKH